MDSNETKSNQGDDSGGERAPGGDLRRWLGGIESRGLIDGKESESNNPMSSEDRLDGEEKVGGWSDGHAERSKSFAGNSRGWRRDDRWGLEGKMKRILDKDMCQVHLSGTEAKGPSIEDIRSMLSNDLSGTVVVGVPGPEIVPILQFFQRSPGKRFSVGDMANLGPIGVILSEPSGPSLDGKEDGGKEKAGGRRRKKKAKEEGGKPEDAGNQGKGARPNGKGRKEAGGLEDYRYRYFLQRIFPTIQRDETGVQEYIMEQRAMLLRRARENQAEVPEVGISRGKAPMDVISSIPEISGTELSEEDDRAVEELILKYGNDFKRIMGFVPHLSAGKCVLKYYLMKNKTHAYIKQKPGRISDSEIKLIVEGEWSEYERDMFIQHFKVFGRSWGKYRSVINKSERDLKIFFRYYTKFVLPLRKGSSVAAVGKRYSVGKEEVLRKWTIDERQVFAIYFPYYNRNWVSMAAYFPSKTPSDLRQYYNRYYKNLSYNEQRLEASLYNFGRELRTPPASHIGSSREEVVFCKTAGVLFKR